VSNPVTRSNVGTRFDYQVSKNNTVTGRYQFFAILGGRRD
jgi:hypothetical protein